MYDDDNDLDIKKEVKRDKSICKKIKSYEAGRLKAES